MAPQLQPSPELDEVYRLFGICSHHCSNIENRFCYFLMQKKWQHNQSKLDVANRSYQDASGIQERVARLRDFESHLEQVEIEIDKLYDLTMGQLVSQLKNDYQLTQDQIDHFKVLKDKRNYLIHKFWGHYGQTMLKREVLIQMKEDLDQHVRYFQSVSFWLGQQIPDVHSI